MKLHISVSKKCTKILVSSYLLLSLTLFHSYPFGRLSGLALWDDFFRLTYPSPSYRSVKKTKLLCTFKAKVEMCRMVTVPQGLFSKL